VSAEVLLPGLLTLIWGFAFTGWVFDRITTPIVLYFGGVSEEDHCPPPIPPAQLGSPCAVVSAAG
jgi:hypothetical protein